MKTLLKYIGLAVAATAIFAGCNKSELNESRMMTITCGTPEDSKTYADGAVVKWATGDIIYVYEVGKYGKANEKVFTLVGGAGTHSGTFTGQEIAEGTEIVATHDSHYAWVDGKYYYDVLWNLNLEDCVSGNDKINRTIPIYSKGVVGTDGKTQLSFHHREPMLRLNVSNATGADKITIKQIKITSSESNTGSRMEVNPSTWETSKDYSSSYLHPITATGALELDNVTTSTLDFVIAHRDYTYFLVHITDGNGNQYSFRKASFKAEKGVLHEFNVALKTPDPVPYYISVNGGADQPYYIGYDFPVEPGVTVTSIKLKPSSMTSLFKNDISALFSTVSKLSAVTSVDLSSLDYQSTTWDIAVNNNTKLGDFYYPKNVTKTSGYSGFNLCNNCKLHVPANLTFLDLIVFGGSSALNAGCGFFVDPENKTYSSYEGALYSKDGKKLVQYPAFAAQTAVIKDGTQTLEGFAISNNKNILTVEFPSSITALGNNFLYATSVNKLIFHPVVTRTPEVKVSVPTMSSFMTKSTTGEIIIDTGNAEDDIAAAFAFYAAWNTTIKSGWVIKTKSGQAMPIEQTAPKPLVSGTKYENVW